MKGDFSRLTFDPAKHFSRVLMQQGRVQLDADWNEQSSLLVHHLRELARVIIGPHGGEPQAFAVTVTGDERQLSFGEGVYFVRGIMCRSDGRLAFTPPADWKTTNSGPERPAGDYLVYLHVTERHVTFVNDDSLRERALGDGVDTATRTKVVCAASATKLPPRPVNENGAVEGGPRDAAISAALAGVWPEGVAPTMRAATAKVGTPPHEVCTVSPFAEYRGAGNQLYRVEIHDPSEGGEGATFKWSRENGSVVFPVLGEASGRRVVVERYGREGRFSLRKGDYVEFEDDDLIASGRPLPLAQVKAVEGGVVTLDPEPPEKFGADAKKHPLLRRWDYAPYDKGKYKDAAFERGLINIGADDKPYPLEQGIEVTFRSGGGEYRRGDYWLIPARTTGGKLDWPEEKPAPDKPAEGKFLPARRAEGGVAPLAVITVSENQIDKEEGDVTDLRLVIEHPVRPAE